MRPFKARLILASVALIWYSVFVGNTYVLWWWTLLDEEPRYLLVESNCAPDVFRKVLLVKRLLASGRARCVNEAVREAGLSRSAFYKYRDKVHPFNERDGGRIITLSVLLHDAPGVLSQVTGQLYQSGANILTINQSIPVGGIAPVSVTARIGGMRMSLDALLALLRETEGVDHLEILSGGE